MPFPALGLAPAILKALLEEGYEKPTPIQAQAIGPIMEGRDVLGCAQTGTGKTAAFALPILHRLSIAPVDKMRRGPILPRVLLLAPTRELANQIGESFATYGRHTGLVHTCVYGGVSQFHQVKALRRGVDVLVATPGRLMDLMEQRLVNLSAVGIFVLDEADRMLDMGFIQPIRKIAAALPSATPRQTLLFSATMPREIMHLADSLLRTPVKIAVTPTASAAPLIEQSLYFVPRQRKIGLLRTLLANADVTRAVVFSKTKHGADKLCKHLIAGGVSAVAIHGNKAQNQRDRALDSFRAGRTRLLIATDVAARGLDVDDISHVFNFDLPIEPEAYVHRIGRTGRAGATGIAISFCDNEEKDLLRRIERLTGKRIPTIPLPEIPAEFAVVHRDVVSDGDQRDSRDNFRGGRSNDRSSGPRGARSGGHARSAGPSHAPRGPRPGPEWHEAPPRSHHAKPAANGSHAPASSPRDFDDAHPKPHRGSGTHAAPAHPRPAHAPAGGSHSAPHRGANAGHGGPRAGVNAAGRGKKPGKRRY